MAMDAWKIVEGLEEIAQLARQAPPPGERIATIAERLKQHLSQESAEELRKESEDEGAGLVQPPRDN
jgi:hypothetical protein